MRYFWFAPLLATFATGAHIARADVEFDGSIGAGGIAPTGTDPDFTVDYLIPYDERVPEAGRFGARRGGNLFHSLDRLDLLATERATFQAIDGTGAPLLGIDRVIARITSGDASLIEGVLRSEVMRDATIGADLFLINPAGITFRGQGGLRSQLDVPGSFTASTASFLRFDDASTFATGGAIAPATLSTAPIAAFGFNSGVSASVRFEATQPFQVATGETLRVVASDVVLTDDSTLFAPGGEILLAAPGSAAAEVPIDVASWTAGPDSGDVIVEAFSDVNASNPLDPTAPQGRIVLRGGRLIVDDSAVQAGGNDGTTGLAIDAEFSSSIHAQQDARLQVFGMRASGVGGARLEAPLISVRDPGTFVGMRNIDAEAGTFLVSGDTVRVEGGGVLGTQAFGSAQGATLRVEAIRTEVTSGGGIQSRNFGSGAGGAVEIVSQDLAIDAATITSTPSAAGRAGDISITSDRVDVFDQGAIASDTATAQQAGNIAIVAGRVSLASGGQIRSLTTATGDAGDLDIQAAESLLITGEQSGDVSGVFARSEASATGAAGSIRVSAPIVDLEGDAAISVRSLGSGDSGTLTIEEADLVRLRTNPAGIAEISARAFNGASAGSLRIEADRVEVLDGSQISASTLGTSPAGDLAIGANEVVVRGQNAAGNASGILSQSVPFSLLGGDAGDITIELEGDLDVSDGGEISARSAGGGEAGSVSISVGGDIDISDGGSINAETSRGTAVPAGGNISLSADHDIRVQRGGAVTARSARDQDAGNISITAGRRLQVTESDITTDVDEVAGPEAAGGRIALQGGTSVELLRSRVTTSVQGRAGDENGGDIDIGDRLVIVNQSEVLAQAVLGNGGNIRIVASNYFESSDSTVNASSELGVDGTVQIEAPDTQLKGELDRLPARFLDASALLREHCAARVAGRGSFVVAGTEGQPRSPDTPLSVGMPLDEGASADIEPKVSATPRLRLAPEDCNAIASLVARSGTKP